MHLWVNEQSHTHTQSVDNANNRTIIFSVAGLSFYLIGGFEGLQVFTSLAILKSFSEDTYFKVNFQDVQYFRSLYLSALIIVFHDTYEWLC